MLTPLEGVVVNDGPFVATTREPWLRIEIGSLPRGLVEIRYSAGFYDDPVRPLLRIEGLAGQPIRVLPAPVCGSAVWRGVLPHNMRSLAISPVSATGRFDFRIDSVRALNWREGLSVLSARGAKALLSTSVPFALGYRDEAARAAEWATAWTPMADFPRWRAARTRPLEPDGLDVLRPSAASCGPFVCVVDSRLHSAQALHTTIASLNAQTFDRWQLVVLHESTHEVISDDPRVAFSRSEAFDLAAFGDDAWLGVLDAGDALEPYALACLAERIGRMPRAMVVYADEMVDNGGLQTPLFKPDWSPLFERARPYVGDCVFVRGDALAGRWPSRETLREAALSAAPADVLHVRRLLLHRPARPAPMQAQAPAISERPETYRVTVIVCTHDRADLLLPCIESVLNVSTRNSFDVIVVDHNTTQREARVFLDKISADSRVKIVGRTDAFNFAAFNNDAAAQCDADVLVFLNNDTIVRSAGWLDALTQAAMRPDVGAVGAKLLFPDGRIQHAGVVVGLGEEAGHIGANVSPDTPSWLGRTDHPHEVSAVTAACLAVEGAKFFAVGGFDAQNLPIEFNDVDLCLRLTERGWKSVYLPDVVVTHRESASRGHARTRPMSRYADQRAYFCKKWRTTIRNDPFFHPAFSLYSRRPDLG